MSEFEEDFAAMFEASVQAAHFEKGQTVEGTVVGIGHGVAFVNLGGKGEAHIDLSELKDADGRLDVAIGARVRAVIVSTEGGVTLSRRLARGAATNRKLGDAFRAGLPVDGRVESVVKGGYEVRLGGQRAFCPFSQIDVVRTADPEQHVGHSYTFRITEYSEGGRNVVVSRRALLEEEQRAAADAARQSIVPGAVVKGRVASVRDFGAFVDLGGGVQGLLHASEVGWSHVSDVSTLLMPGDEITVKVLRVDEASQKIALSMKQLLADPWLSVTATYAPGQVCMGRVTRVADFGAFVELAPGIEGLAHASTFAPTGQARGWSRSVPVGLTAPFEILSIEPEKRRIGVALVADGAAGAATMGPAQTTIDPGVQMTGKVERHETFGVFVFLAPGRTGLMPLSETGLIGESDVRRAFPVGSDVEVVVLEVDATGRRIRVSHKAVQAAADAAAVREYAERAGPSSTAGFGSLGDSFRGRIKPSAP